MEALSVLKNANILGHLLTHMEDFEGYPEAYARFFRAIAPFHGHITYSGTNTAIDRYMSGVIVLGPPASACTSTCIPICMPHIPSITNADQIHILHGHVRDICKYQKKPTPIGLHSTKSKCCHKCHQLRHIRRKCPCNKKVFHFK